MILVAGDEGVMCLNGRLASPVPLAVGGAGGDVRCLSREFAAILTRGDRPKTPFTR